jgi:hypothetical protein
MMQEIHNGRYGVDEIGFVYSLRNHAGNRRTSPKRIATKRTPAGYLTCGAYKDGPTGTKRRTYFVHRLVALAWVPNPCNKPNVNHIDGNKTNNHPSNLEWVTSSENSLHAFRLGLRHANPAPYKGRFNEQHPKSAPIRQLTLNGEVVQTFPSMQEAKRQGFSQANISSVIAGKRQSHKGFRWELA